MTKRRFTEQRVRAKTQSQGRGDLTQTLRSHGWRSGAYRDVFTACLGQVAPALAVPARSAKSSGLAYTELMLLQHRIRHLMQNRYLVLNPFLGGGQLALLRQNILQDLSRG